MRILFATDGSEGSMEAARFLSRLGHHRNVHVHIVTARENGDPDDGSDILRDTQAAFGDFAGHATHAMFRADSTSEIVDGILFIAGYVGADLIVVGARGRSAVARFLVGSVAESVARHANIPVLVARLSETDTVTEVIIAVDGSRNAYDAAMFVTKQFPLPPNCLFRLENVLQHPRWAAYPDLLAIQGVSTMVEETERANASHAQSVLANLRQELEAEGATVETEVLYGAPATKLVDVATTRRAGLIVLGSRGLNEFERLLIGSVSDRVLWHASCSVLVCRQSNGDTE